MLDQILADTADRPFDRPQQLFLTGDQIYADEVADVLLMSLMDAGVALLGWDERLPADRDSANIPFGPYDSSKLLPSTRTGPITNARFTTQDMRSHLMSLGEPFAMYLFASSEELWKDDLGAAMLPTVAELKARLPGDARMSRSIEADAEEQRKAVIDYPRHDSGCPARAGEHPQLHDVRRPRDHRRLEHDAALCETVYASALGTRVVKNG